MLVCLLLHVRKAAFTLFYFGLELEAGGNGATKESLERSASVPPDAGGRHPRGLPRAVGTAPRGSLRGLRAGALPGS